MWPFKRKHELRLLLWEDCDRSCDGCCNKDWDLDSLATATDEDYRGAKLIMLTGGEPLLYPERLEAVIRHLRTTTKAKIVLYTAMVSPSTALHDVLPLIDGVTVTLHDQADADNFTMMDCRARFNLCYKHDNYMRLNVFKGVHLEDKNFMCPWQPKYDIEWIKDSPLPENEIFRRY